MTHEELLRVLEPTGLPWAYHHWEQPPPPPYGVYLDNSYDPFYADNRNYFNVRRVRLEVYSGHRDAPLDARVEAALDAASVPYEADFEYLESEQLYESIYEIEV